MKNSDDAEATELHLFFSWGGAAGGDVAGVCVAEFIARIVVHAAVPFCGGTNLKQTNLRPLIDHRN